MINTKKIILISVIVLAIISGLIFWLSLKVTPKTPEVTVDNNQKTITNKINAAADPILETVVQNNNPSNNQPFGEAEEKNITLINQTVNKVFPETNLVQLNSFLEIANSENMGGCEDLSEKTDECKYYFSIYQGDSVFCGDIDDKNIQLNCYKELAPLEINTKLDKCQKISGSNHNCLIHLFWAVKDLDSCAIFKDQEINQLCLDVVNFNEAISANVSKCNLIRNQLLKDFCEQLFVAGDFDEDGLSDREESKIGTSPYLADTDGDGFSDKKEFSDGYNPCGEGKVPAAAELLKVCAKYTN